MNFKSMENGDSSPIKLESLQNLIAAFTKRLLGEYHGLDTISDASSEDSTEDVFLNQAIPDLCNKSSNQGAEYEKLIIVINNII